jgi:phosphoglycolate phosphatase
MDITSDSIQAHNPSGFRWQDADAYLFDIDGTLLVTRDLVHWNALSRAMREVYGVDTTIEGIAYHGKTDLGILRAALERVGISGPTFEANLPSALEVICRDVADNNAGIKPEICPSIPDILYKLKTAGKLLGVASGNLESVGWEKIKSARLREFFSFGCYSDRNEMRSDIFRSAVAEVKKQLGNDATTCFVGDTPEDIKAAKAANAPIIAVSTGIFSLGDLQSHSPDFCVSSCAGLFAL